MSDGMEVHERLRRYYTAYYRDTLAIPDWATLVELRQTEERLEAQHLERVRRLVGPAAFRGRLLNVGCGTGGFNVLAAAEGARVVGVDESGEAIGISGLKACKAGGSVVQAHAEALPFPDRTFDLVYCFSAIEHVHSIGDSIREIVRVTRPAHEQRLGLARGPLQGPLGALSAALARPPLPPRQGAATGLSRYALAPDAPPAGAGLPCRRRVGPGLSRQRRAPRVGQPPVARPALVLPADRREPVHRDRGPPLIHADL
jgi:SAM-dependent methyltransferase